MAFHFSSIHNCLQNSLTVLYDMTNISDMYDVRLFKKAMLQKGYNFHRLGSEAGIDPKTVKKVVVSGRGNPESAYRVALALGFPVKPIGNHGYDLSSILRKTA